MIRTGGTTWLVGTAARPAPPIRRKGTQHRHTTGRPAITSPFADDELQPNRVLSGALEMLEPCTRKRVSTVPRGGRGGDASPLLCTRYGSAFARPLMFSAPMPVT